MSSVTKIGSFFSNFFHNVKADPMSTISGVGKIVAGGAMIYAAPTSITGDITAAGLITSGIVSLGTNHTTGAVNPTIAKGAQVEQKAAQTVSEFMPVALFAVDSYKQIAKEAELAKIKLDQFSAVSSALQTAIDAAQTIQVAPVAQEAEKAV